eukprot:GHVU01000295.1.p1 GENE.GHVU01000295.1~~GHVU01000295.1.p1  ORF type:complete len:107 (-),score=7.48 GHVU01000295.1:363-683(-)
MALESCWTKCMRRSPTPIITSRRTRRRNGSAIDYSQSVSVVLISIFDALEINDSQRPVGFRLGDIQAQQSKGGPEKPSKPLSELFLEYLDNETKKKGGGEENESMV